MTKEEVLLEFDKGFDCCQVVFHHWAQKLGVEEELAYKVSTGFGAGMLQGETCGAVIGAYMALGLKYGCYKTGEEGEKQKVTSIIKNVQFREKFLEKYSSSMCKDLLQADVSTQEGMKVIQDQQLMNTFCPQLVADISDILEEIVEEE